MNANIIEQRLREKEWKLYGRLAKVAYKSRNTTDIKKIISLQAKANKIWHEIEPLISKRIRLSNFDKLDIRREEWRE